MEVLIVVSEVVLLPITIRIGTAWPAATAAAAWPVEKGTTCYFHQINYLRSACSSNKIKKIFSYNFFSCRETKE